jgi:hypothetical protein
LHEFKCDTIEFQVPVVYHLTLTIAWSKKIDVYNMFEIISVKKLVQQNTSSEQNGFEATDRRSEKDSTKLRRKVARSTDRVAALIPYKIGN